MTVPEALTLFAVMLPLAAMPSASVALVVARTVAGGRISGLFTTLGIVVGDLVFVAMALWGLSLLAGWLGTLFSVVKYGGGAYLIWLGFTLLTSPAPAAVQPGAVRGASPLADFAAGLVLTLGDIKAILFYASLFPALVDMASVDGWDMAWIALITLVAVGGVKLLYVGFASRILAKLRGVVATDVPRKLGGVVMMGCGSVLIAKA